MAGDIRVLCVDDDPSIVELLSTVLDGEPGFAALTQTDPRQALELFDARKIDCVVSDYHMPGMDGLELLAAVRERDAMTPFILFTGKGTEEIASTAVSEGVTDYIRKATGTEQFDLLVNRIRNAVEHRRARVNYREVFDAVDDAILVIDPETGTLVDVNRAACDLWGFPEEALVGRDPADLGVDEADGDDVATRLRTAAVDDGDRFDWRCERADGGSFSASVSVRGAVIEGEQRTLAVVRDVTRRREREDALAVLLDGTKDIVGAETRQRIVELATDIATEELGVDPETVEVRDDPGKMPDGHSQTSVGVGEAAGGDEPLGQPDGTATDPSINIAIDSVEGFEQDLLALLEGTATATYVRASKEELLRERERTLERQRAELARLNRLNEVIRKINRTLVRATTRNEVERLVCEQLVAADPHRFAWIGSPDYGADEIVPQAWAGIDAGYLQESSFPVDEDTLDGAVETAVVDHEVGLVEDVSAAAPTTEEHERGFGSVAVIPVVYGTVLYNVLAVYADEPRAFGEVDVLRELGETIGYAMHNAEQHRRQVDDRAVELSFAVRSDDWVLNSISERLSERVELQGTNVDTDGTVRLFLETGNSAEASALTDAHENVVEATSITSDADLHEVVLEGSTTRDLFCEHRASIRNAYAEDDDARIVVELPGGFEVRTFVDRFADEYGAELIARRDRPYEPGAIEGWIGDLADLLTPRQYEVLLTANHSGYFEWPREQSGQEVSDGMGISQPTFHEHLRTGQQRLFSELFDGRSS